MELQTEKSHLMQENVELREKIADQEAKWEIHEDLMYEENAYWSKSGKDSLGKGPFCVSCWDDKLKLMHMPGNKGRYSCPVCGYHMQTEASKQQEDDMIQNWNSK